VNKAFELDVCYMDHEGETIEQALAALTAGTAIVATVVLEHGPAGGWPLVRFEGADAELRTMLMRYSGGDAAEARELSSELLD